MRPTKELNLRTRFEATTNEQGFGLELTGSNIGLGIAWRSEAFSELADAIRRCRTPSYSLWRHSLAVGATSYRLAALLGLDAERRHLAYLGGLFHDAGKTKARPETLFKNGPLDAAEQAHLREHPRLGAAMVEALGLDAVVEAAHCHHEMFDGSGYPDGLRGSQIPLTARVVAVADHFEAMCESRPYRPVGLGRSDALALVADLAERGSLDRAVTIHLAAATAERIARPDDSFHRFGRALEPALHASSAAAD
jgi:putative nucleotidyltransferase with HDIG domain